MKISVNIYIIFEFSLCNLVYKLFYLSIFSYNTNIPYIINIFRNGFTIRFRRIK